MPARCKATRDFQQHTKVEPEQGFLRLHADGLVMGCCCIVMVLQPCEGDAQVHVTAPGAATAGKDIMVR
jgi:hypothetical protein